MRILFIHRSVGKHLIKYGDIRRLLAPDVEFDDYNNNDGFLTRSDGTKAKHWLVMPGNNTNPDNLAAFFKSWNPALDDYDLVMIKSCYPNSHISGEKHLEQIKEHYRTIVSAFAKHHKPLLILTSPPLRPLFTNAQEVKLARKLAVWLASQSAPDLHVFDFHSRLAGQTGSHTGMLRLAYRRPLPWDNHPNRLAHRRIAPELAAFIKTLQ